LLPLNPIKFIMNKKLYSALLIALIIVSGTSCKKYEDGPSFSFRSVKKRVVNTWKIETYSVNGVELSGLPEYSTQKQFWLGDGVYNQTFIDPTTGIGKRVDGSWQLQDGDNKIALTLNNVVTGQPQTTTGFQILKLCNNTMWLRSLDNSIEMHLVTNN
jgi:hypothetical protein